MAAPRKRDWNSLSPGYQKRLKGAGITKRQYESGASLQKARGHSQTPEHPERAGPTPPPGTPDKYKRYRDKIKNAVQYVQDFKKEKWGTRPKWNEKRSLMNVRKDPETGKMRGVKDLQVIKAMVGIAKEDGWVDWHGIIELDPDYESAFYYH